MNTPTKGSRSALGTTLIGALAVVAVVAFIGMRQSPSLAGSSGQPALAASAAVPSSAAEAPAILQVEAAEDPESAATKALVEEYDLKCTMASDVTFQPNPKALAEFDNTIADQNVDSGWVVSGEVYKGAAEDAAGAFKSTKAFAHDESVWIVVPGDVPMAVELRALETPAKNVVWIPLNTVQPCVDHD